MKQPPIQLLNCRICDDILRVHEEMPRTCLCGKSAARYTGKEFSFTGSCRILIIDIEEYDGAAPGKPRKWTVADG
jgi:hypothetical protein